MQKVNMRNVQWHINIRQGTPQDKNIEKGTSYNEYNANSLQRYNNY